MPETHVPLRPAGAGETTTATRPPWSARAPRQQPLRLWRWRELPVRAARLPVGVTPTAPSGTLCEGFPGRAVPDVPALGMPDTRYLIGQTQTFPDCPGGAPQLLRRVSRWWDESIMPNRCRDHGTVGPESRLSAWLCQSILSTVVLFRTMMSDPLRPPSRVRTLTITLTVAHRTSFVPSMITPNHRRNTQARAGIT